MQKIGAPLVGANKSNNLHKSAPRITILRDAGNDGIPDGKPEDFLTGFIKNLQHEKVYGRPVCVLMLMDGSLLITDDTSNKIWRVAYGK